jgi:hypothetical protein
MRLVACLHMCRQQLSASTVSQGGSAHAAACLCCMAPILLLGEVVKWTHLRCVQHSSLQLNVLLGRV